MARILCLDSDTHFSGSPGGQARFTRDIVEPLGLGHSLEIVSVGSFEQQWRGSVNFRTLVRSEEVTRRTQLTFASRQRQFVRREAENYDLIVENFIPPIGPSALPRLTSTPIIGLANFSFWDEMSAKYHLPFTRLTKSRLTAYQWIATTHESVAKKVRLLTPTTDVRAISQVVETDARWNDLPGTRALFLGRPDVHQKGLDLLVRALHHLGRGAPPVDIAGFDSDHPSWRTLTRRWPLPDTVVVHGYVSGTSREELLRTSRVLLLPSRYEGPSYIPLEGAFRGIPTVAFALDCFADRRDAMYLATPFDVEDFARNIATAFDNLNLYDRKREGAQEISRRARSQDPRRDFADFVRDILAESERPRR